MIIHTSKALKNYNTLNIEKAQQKQQEIIPNVSEEKEKVEVKPTAKKKKKALPIVIDELVEEEKNEKVEDEDLSKWLEEHMED